MELDPSHQTPGSCEVTFFLGHCPSWKPDFHEGQTLTNLTSGPVKMMCKVNSHGPKHIKQPQFLKAVFNET